MIERVFDMIVMGSVFMLVFVAIVLILYLWINDDD